jgi:hypothetical protein
MSVSQNTPVPQRRDEHACNEQTSSSQIAGSSWSPYINGPIVSILDVAPLNLVGRYMDDVYNGMKFRRHLLHCSLAIVFLLLYLNYLCFNIYFD